MNSRNERGAVVLMTALFTVVILGICALAVDLGMQRVVRRDMQALADVVALDMARDLDQGKTKAEVLADPTWSAHLGQSIERNSTTLGDAPTVVPYLGTVDSAGVFHESASTDVPTAVKISAQSQVNFAFISGRGGAIRSAVATANPPCAAGDPLCGSDASDRACLRVGSWAAQVNSTFRDSLLNQALHINAGAVNYDGLATSKITLGEIAAKLGVGSVENLANADIEVDRFFRAVGEIAQAKQLAGASTMLLLGDRSNNSIYATNSTVVKTIHLGASVVTDPSDGSQKTIGLFDLGNSGDAGIGATISLLDIVSGAAFVANGTNALQAPVSVNLPGLGSTTSTVTVIERPQVKCGPVGTFAETAQIRVQIDGNFTPSLPSGSPTFQLQSGATVPVHIDVKFAGAKGTLVNSILCSNVPTTADPEGIDVAVHTDAVTASISSTVNLNYSGLSVSGLTGIVGLLGVPITTDVFHGSVSLAVGSSLSVLPGDSTVQFRSPPMDYDDKMSVSSAPISMATPTALPAPISSTNTGLLALVGTVTGSNKATVEAAIRNTLSLHASLDTNMLGPLVTGVNNTLIQAISDVLGQRQVSTTVGIAGADVWAHERPTCQGPILVG